jgi:hypothetical protein
MSDQMQCEIAELSHRMDELEDPRDCYALIKERINTYRSKGSTVPEELARMEHQLMTECMAQSQGR